jgi:hypothetical protein
LSASPGQSSNQFTCRDNTETHAIDNRYDAACLNLPVHNTCKSPGDQHTARQNILFICTVRRPVTPSFPIVHPPPSFDPTLPFFEWKTETRPGIIRFSLGIATIPVN